MWGFPRYLVPALRKEEDSLLISSLLNLFISSSILFISESNLQQELLWLSCPSLPPSWMMLFLFCNFEHKFIFLQSDALGCISRVLIHHRWKSTCWRNGKEISNQLESLLWAQPCILERRYCKRRERTTPQERKKGAINHWDISFTPLRKESSSNKERIQEINPWREQSFCTARLFPLNVTFFQNSAFIVASLYCHVIVPVIEWSPFPNVIELRVDHREVSHLHRHSASILIHFYLVYLKYNSFQVFRNCLLYCSYPGNVGRGEIFKSFRWKSCKLHLEQYARFAFISNDRKEMRIRNNIYGEQDSNLCSDELDIWTFSSLLPGPDIGQLGVQRDTRPCSKLKICAIYGNFDQTLGLNMTVGLRGWPLARHTRLKACRQFNLSTARPSL